MTFLHPMLLWLVPLAAIPILLHLLTLRRLRTVELSTFRFLFDSYVRQRRRMKFLEALLATLRTLFLLFLVLVISRPVVRHWDALFGGRASGRDVVMLIDSSASMNAVTDGVSAFARAKTAALAVAGELGVEDRLTVIRVTSKPQEVFSRFTSDAEAIRDKIESLETGSARANLLVALSSVFGEGTDRWGHATVYLFTDGQASGWRELARQGSGRLIPEGTRFIVVNVGSDEDLPNRAVVGDVVRPHRAIRGLPIMLRSRVVNHSPADAAEVPVSAFVGEKEIARTTLTLEPGESQVAEWVYVPDEPGVCRGRFEIPADRFPDDDSFLFTLAVESQVKVLLVNGKPAKDPLDDEALYLRTALTARARDEQDEPKPRENEADALGPGDDFVRSLDVREIPEPKLDAQTLEDAGVVILANCGRLRPPQYVWLRDFVADGGGLIILPGDQVKPEQYNKQFLPVPGPQQERLTAVTFGPPQGDPDDAEAFERLASIDFAHPVLSVFDDPVARYLGTVRFFRHFELTLPEDGGGTWPLVSFSSGKPALVESRFGDGIVLTGAFPANNRWTNLVLKPEFVPLVLRMVSHVVHRAELEVPSVVPADGTAVVAAVRAPVTGKVTGPTGRSGQLAFERSGGRWVSAFEQTGEKGYYAVEIQGEHSEEHPPGEAAFAVNLAPGESKFETVGEEELRRLLPTAELTVVDASAETQQLRGSIGEKREIWRPLTIIMFIVIGLEFMLATLGGQQPGVGEPATVTQRIRGMSPGTIVGEMTGAVEPEAME